jgi:hypothetical protein
VTLPYGFPRPTAITPQGAPQLVELDRRSVSLSSKPAVANGQCTVVFDQVGSDRFWLVDRVIVSNTSSTPTTAYVGDGDPTFAANFLGGTYSGNFDYDDTHNPYYVESGKQFQVLWIAASLNAVGTARIQYRVMQRA